MIDDFTNAELSQLIRSRDTELIQAMRDLPKAAGLSESATKAVDDHFDRVIAKHRIGEELTYEQIHVLRSRFRANTDAAGR